MKIIIIAIVLLANLTYADFIRTSIGGNIAVELEEDTKKDTDKLNYSIFVDFKHPIPVMPNIRIVKSSSSISDDLDAISYYNILDETFLLYLDVGVGIQNKKISQIDYDKTGPSAYTKVKIDLPLSNLSFKLRGIASVLDKDNSYRVETLLEYKVIDNIAFDLIFDIGYKKEHIDLEKKKKDESSAFLELNFTI